MEAKRDQNGFIVLNQKEAKVEKPKEKKKASPRPYKKGSWKDVLFRFAKRWKSLSTVSDFTFIKANSLIIVPNEDKAINLKTVTLKKVRKLMRKFPDAYTLVECFNCNYMKLTLDCYLKMMQTEKIAIRFRLQQYDYYDEDKWVDSYEETHLVSTINELLYWINYLRYVAEWHDNLSMSSMMGDILYRFEVRSVIIFKDGTTKAFKGDFNEVLEYYGYKMKL